VDIWRERLTAVLVEWFGKRRPLVRQEAAQ
jgi:hypothetical protein